MKHILEFFHDIVPVIFVVGIIAVAFVFYNHTRNLAAAAVEKSYTFDEQLNNADILVLDQMTVSGADVKKFVKDFYKVSSFDISISHINGGTRLTTNDVSLLVSSAATYLCTVKSHKGTVTSVAFSKQ